MQTYVLTLDCETCGATMRSRIGDLSADPSAEPVINLDLAVSQTDYHCDECGGSTYLGDIEDICHHEPGQTDDDEGDPS